MKRMLSVDPGLHGLGCGVFEDDVLVAAWYAPCPGLGRGPLRWKAVVEAGLGPLRGVPVDVVVVEVMQVYPTGSRPRRFIDPADILEVQGVAGAVIGWAPAGAVSFGYLPRDWKGAVQQGVYAKRVDAYLKLRGWDGACLPCPVHRRHDMLHGVGVGLHHLGLIRAGRTGRPKKSRVADDE